jgi:hypothetical protein
VHLQAAINVKTAKPLWKEKRNIIFSYFYFMQKGKIEKRGSGCDYFLFFFILCTFLSFRPAAA